MNNKKISLALIVAAIAISACNRHKNQQPIAQPTAPSAASAEQAVPVPVEPPKGNEPQPKVSRDSATQKLFAGQFKASDGQIVHGTALILKTDDGYAVRIEGLHVDDNLPAIQVVLSTHPVNSIADTANGTVVGEIKGSTGNMNYPVEAHLDPAKYQTLSLIVRSQNLLLATASFGLM